MSVSVDSLAASLASSAIGGESILSYKDQGLRLDCAQDAEEIAKALEEAESVDTFEISGNTVGVEAGKRLAQALEKRVDLKRALWDDIFRTRLKDEIPTILRSLLGAVTAAGARLTVLDLSDNAFGPHGASGVEDFFRTPSSFSLQELKLNNLGLGIAGGKIMAQALVDCHKLSVDAGHPLKLKVFVAGRNRQENPGAIAFAHAFGIIGSLEKIVLHQNGIYPQGIKALAEAFGKNKNLKHINIQDNTCRREGAIVLAQVIPKLHQLETLDFGDCLIREAGGLVLAEALKNSGKNIQTLVVSGNEFPAYVAEKLIEVMKRKPNINKLDLSCNSYGSRFDQIKKLATDSGIKDIEIGEEDENEDSPNEEASEEEEEEENEKEDVEEINSTTIWASEFSVNDTPQAHNGRSVIEEGLIHNISIDRLSKLSNPSDALLLEMEDELDNPDAVTRIFIQLASLITIDNKFHLLPMIMQCCEDMMSAARSVRHGPISMESQIINCLLAQLGLIKKDTKSEKPKNLVGIFTVINELVRNGYFRRNAETLKFWLSRPGSDFDDANEIVSDIIKLIDN